MLTEARRRLADADLLSVHPDTVSDADHLLRLLALEILLKALVLIHDGKYERHHSYARLFGSLPESARQRVLRAAAERMSTSAEYATVDDLLDAFGRSFVALRYPYEEYATLSDEAYKEVAAEWLDQGAPVDKATFVYHTEELHGLIVAMTTELDAWLAAA